MLVTGTLKDNINVYVEDVEKNGLNLISTGLKLHSGYLNV